MNIRTANLRRWMMAGLVLVLTVSRPSAEIVSQGEFVAGAVDGAAGPYTMQGGGSPGTGAGESVGGDYRVHSGPLAAIQNRPHFTTTGGTLVAAAGSVVTVSHARVLGLSAAREVDGEALAFRVTTATGLLLQNGQPVSIAILSPGDSFVWSLPNDVATVVPALNVVAVDVVGLASAAGARLAYEENVPPAGNEDEVFRPIGLQPFKIRVADLLANDTDGNDDALAFGGLVAPITGHGRTLLVLDGRWIVYFPAVADEPADDSFSYSVVDGNGGSAEALVWIRERVVDRAGLNIVGTIDQGGGQLTISARGIPGRTYQAQVATAFTPPTTAWVNLGDPVQASPIDGAFTVAGLAAGGAGQRYYRTIEVTGGGAP